MVVRGGDEGELVLVSVLRPSSIIVVENLPLLGDVIFCISSTKHVVQGLGGVGVRGGAGGLAWPWRVADGLAWP